MKVRTRSAGLTREGMCQTHSLSLRTAVAIGRVVWLSQVLHVVLVLFRVNPVSFTQWGNLLLLNQPGQTKRSPPGTYSFSHFPPFCTRSCFFPVTYVVTARFYGPLVISLTPVSYLLQAEFPGWNQTSRPACLWVSARCMIHSGI